MAEKKINIPLNVDLGYDLNDTFVKSLNVCDFRDTLPFIVVLNLIINSIERVDQLSSTIMLILRAIDISTYLNDIVDLSTIVQGLSEHIDAYNFGQAMGKAIKIITQLYLEGVMAFVWEHFW